LKSLSKQEIETVLKKGKFRTTAYKKNSVVHLDGEYCHKLEIILSGKVVVDRIDESGNLLTISEFYSDDILGGNLLFSRNPYYPMTVTTRLPSVLLEIEKELLFELFYKNPQFLHSFLEHISDRALILGHKIKYYINKTIRESIMNYLEYESIHQHSNIIKLSITKKALADKIGVQRTSLSRELAKMKKDGLILFSADTIELIKT
jgi:CRP-like cAMP-binding protein